ncbi:epoxide hydrolase N-terminal domain-containing protein [Pseudonocardia zijingensis]|uniref:Epoxide hydrolase N-terminal domain-containing protein n=1 Tax=Pseudonocardia zijingensis TaxID=153376 RepID=A0ABN1N9A1_9PSEU
MSFREQRVHISDDVLADLARRLDGTRRPTVPVRSSWSDGIDPELVHTLAKRWRHSFDWRAREASLNRYRHIWAEVDGLSVHTMISRPAEPPHALPLLVARHAVLTR